MDRSRSGQVRRDFYKAATVAVVASIDPEHLDYYGDFEALKHAFIKFTQNIPFYGFATMCIDDEEVRALISKSLIDALSPTD